MHPCVTTDVFRTVERGNPLPTYFGRLAALDQQDVQASATVEVMQANESPCLQHWGIADRWVDGTPGEEWEFGATWDDAVDSYIPPDATHPGTGLQVANSAGEFCCDYGHEFVLQNQDRRNARFYGRLGFGGSGCVAGDWEMGAIECAVSSIHLRLLA